ncbi:MAG: DHH family phosphoesterase [Lachnospiraceae bacterium]|jgi:c-di-AMP phosphodiesterase-like protein|nr:DHH family phosphoesterase [Lachnospiraceae bacterium]
MSKKTKAERGITGSFRWYFRWPLLLSVLLICMNVAIYLIDTQSGIVMSFFVLVYVGIAIAIFIFRKGGFQRQLVRYATGFMKSQKTMLKELNLPYALLDLDGRLIWGNDAFLDVIHDERQAKGSITNVFPSVEKELFPSAEADAVLHTEFEERNYKIVLRRAMDEEMLEKAGEAVDPGMMVSMYLYDETEIVTLQRENQDQKMILGLLYIDNYEEALESIDEVRRSLLIALIDRKINKYMQSIDAIVRSLEKDKYIVIFQMRYLAQLQQTRFSLLDEVRAVNIGNEMAVTISLGLGISGTSYQQSYDYARAAIDLALGRGGDQVVIKEGEKIQYYGGKSQQVEKNTRVKARVKAHALRELLEAKERVMIMGHSMADVDSLGAAVGIYRISKMLGTRAHIVINEITTSVAPILNRFKHNPEYEEDLFVNSEQALQMVDKDTMLVVVDVNRPSYTECEELLKRVNTVVILDHHRQSGDTISTAVLSYIEPYASSACEMVAEILQYTGQDVKLRPLEADAMYSGIMVDTDNFLVKTGVRTFEAAAYLRRNGADITKIRKTFRAEMNEFKMKAKSISTSEVFLEHFALAECHADGVESPTILGAQVANELMDISGIKASFVFTYYNEKVYISARSIDELNVQVVMEKLGGGGHMSVAGAQLKDVTIPQAMKIVKELLEQMKEEGEL